MQKKMRLSALFSDGMVLQREVENSVWGYAHPGEEITITIERCKQICQADDSGYFETMIPAMQAGGPYVLSVKGNDEELRVRDILIGDVFLLGGQSNMELPMSRCFERYEKEWNNFPTDKIRMFDVPKEYMFGGCRQELEKGRWVKAREEHLAAFSAVGFFTAQEIVRKENVPVGLLQTAVGGTPLKTWTSAETICELGLDEWELSECLREGYVEQTQTIELEREEMWRTRAREKDEDETNQGIQRVPGLFLDGSLKGFYGGLHFTKKINIPADFIISGEPIKLYVGAMLDADVTYINGVQVGVTEYRYPPRIYPVPRAALKEGENTISIDMLVFRDTGGFMPGMRYEVVCGDKSISIEGDWEYEIVRRMAMLPNMTFFQYKASGLYQGMIYPLRRWKVKACLFYQGESNAERSQTYRLEYEAMIKDWRILFGCKELPFFHVQLAGFSEGRENTPGVEWAHLRQQQYEAQQMPGVYMVQAYDLGEYCELHPTDKRSVGKRMALALESYLYHRDVYCENPKANSFQWKEDRVAITFAPEDTLLRALGDVRGFGMVTSSGEIVPARAKFVGLSKVEVYLDGYKDVQAVTYAWNDCPTTANLYNQAGLPVIPFYQKKDK